MTWRERRYGGWPVLALALTLVVALAACGGQTQGPAPAASTAAPAGSPAAGEAGEKAAVASAGDVEAGEKVYQGTCISCHGPDAHGLEGLGKDLHNNQFAAERSDEEMLAFLKVGRPAGDPLNTTGVDMPPRGGNPALTDTDLLNVVAYVRSLK